MRFLYVVSASLNGRMIHSLKTRFTVIFFFNLASYRERLTIPTIYLVYFNLVQSI